MKRVIRANTNLVKVRFELGTKATCVQVSSRCHLSESSEHFSMEVCL